VLRAASFSSRLPSSDTSAGTKIASLGPIAHALAIALRATDGSRS
jgi:hypothetical protein